MLEQLAAPVVYPLSLAAAKGWLRETTTDSDADITRLIKAAVASVETISHNALVYRPVREQFDYFLPYFELTGYPVRGVTSITYLDSTGTKQTLPAANYVVDTTKGAARITPAYALYFPPTRVLMNAVQVNYDMGLLVPIVGITLATGTINTPGHNKAVGDRVQFSLDGGGSTALASGALPVEIVPGTVYYVASVAGDLITISATSGGGAIAPMTGAFTAPAFLGILPDDMVHAMALILDTWHRNRSSLSPTQIYEVPGGTAAEALLTAYQPRGFQ